MNCERATLGRQIDIIKKPIKARAWAFITVICEGLALMGCLFLCAAAVCVRACVFGVMP